MPLHAATPPHAEGQLDTGDSHRIAWAPGGNPDGRPVVLLHAGLGSGRSRSAPRFFDPARWRIVSFDQRGCGRSEPHAGDTPAALADNTTDHLVADIERLREHLGIGRWSVFGYSSGCTLALVYAEAFPDRVASLLLAGVTMTRSTEIDWLYRGIAPLFPEAFARFRAGAPAGTDEHRLVEAYRDLLADPDPTVREHAARDFHGWEAASALVRPGGTFPEAWRDARYRLGRARLCTHYFTHRSFLADDQVLRDLDRIRHLPCTMVHGQLDLEAPLVSAWELKRA